MSKICLWSILEEIEIPSIVLPDCKEGKMCRKASNRFSQLLFQIDSGQLWPGSQPQSSIKTNHAGLKSNADSRFKDFIKPQIF